MKLNHLAKTVVLGLAVLLASSAFASNKGSLQVREAFEVNGQQLAPGEYQVRWDGTGPNVEVSFMQGKKEVAKATAKVVALDKAYDYDSAVVDHASGKATVSEVRFAGKKYALSHRRNRESRNERKLGPSNLLTPGRGRQTGSTPVLPFVLGASHCWSASCSEQQAAMDCQPSPTRRQCARCCLRWTSAFVPSS